MFAKKNYAVKKKNYATAGRTGRDKYHLCINTITITITITTTRFVDGKPVNIPGHSVPLAGLGGFILVFGFLAFNGGSQVSDLGFLPTLICQASISAEGDGGTVALAIVNTILGEVTDVKVRFLNSLRTQEGRGT